MEEWKLWIELSQSDWDDCPGCGNAYQASMPSEALKDTWKVVHHKIDVCSVALSNQSIRRDGCNIETWTGPSKTAKASTFWWSRSQGMKNSLGSPTCRKLKVVRSDGHAKMEVVV